jgi:hypothetical protein
MWQRQQLQRSPAKTLPALLQPLAMASLPPARTPPQVKLLRLQQPRILTTQQQQG